MKPICANCNMFFRVKRNGEYFEERMPGPDGAKREVAHAEGMHCGLCGEGQPCHGHPLLELEERLHGIEPSRPRLKPGGLEGWQSYKLWVGDLWECRGCGAQVIVGVPPNPIAEHYQPGYRQQVASLAATRRIDDC